MIVDKEKLISINKYTEYNKFELLVEYNYEDIFILPRKLSTTILFSIFNNIYVHVNRKGIRIIKTIAKIVKFYNSSRSNNIFYKFSDDICAIDENYNVYIFDHDTVIKSDHIKTLDLDDMWNYDFCGYHVRKLVRFTFEHDGEFYDMDNNIIIVKYENNTFGCNMCLHKLPIANIDKLYKLYNNRIKSDNIKFSVGYNNNNQFIELTKESLRKINNGFMMANDKEFMNIVKLKDVMYTHNKTINNKRPSICELFLVIKYFAKNNGLVVPKYIMIMIIKPYIDYYHKYQIISKCSEAINFIGYDYNDLVLMASKRFPSAIKYLNNDQKIQLCTKLINIYPNIIKYSDNLPNELYLESVKKSGNVIKHIKNPSLECCIESIKSDYKNVLYHQIIYYNNDTIKNALAKLSTNETDFIISGDEEFTNVLCDINPYMIFSMINPTIPQYIKTFTALINKYKKNNDPAIIKMINRVLNDMNIDTKTEITSYINKLGIINL